MMKKFLILTGILSIITASAAGAKEVTNPTLIASSGYQSSGNSGYRGGQNNLQQSSQQDSQQTARQTQQLQQWLDANPKYAAELQRVTESSDPTTQLQQWFQNHPECAKELQQQLQISK